MWSNRCFLVQLTLGKVCNSSSKGISEMYLGTFHLVPTQIFRETNISYCLIRTGTSAYQGIRNVSFSENFAYVINQWTLKTPANNDGDFLRK